LFSSDDSPESLIPREHHVEGLKITQIRDLDWTAFALAHESSEPLPQAARLGRQAIQLARHRAIAYCREHLRRHQPRLIEPGQKAIAVGDPVDPNVDRGGHRIQEIQAKRVGNEKSGNSLRNQAPLRDPKNNLFEHA
jgi:hypothetical protein